MNSESVSTGPVSDHVPWERSGSGWDSGEVNTPRRLAVARHAQAESYGETDAARPLTERGLRDAAALGRWLAETGFVPDHALVSSAVRTRQTWEAVAGAAGWTLEPDVESALYAASPEAALDLMRLVPDEARCVLVLGHNPTISYLAQMLAGGAGDAAATRAMGEGHPTAGLALLDVSDPWSSLGYGDGTLRAFHVGR